MKNLFLMVALFSVTLLYAQVPEVEWQKSLGGSSYDLANSIWQTTDGGYIVAGYSYSNDGDVSGNHGESDYWIVKLDDTGTILWQKSLGGSDWEEANSIQQTSDEGYILAGFSYSNDGDVSGNHGEGDIWIVKLDSNGDIQWQKTLGGSQDEWLYSMQQTTDGGFIVSGYSYSNDGDVSENHGDSDYWIIKLSADGTIQWEKSYGGSEGDYATEIQQTSDGGFIVAGVSYSNDGDVSVNKGEGDVWIVKLDQNGTIQWEKSYGGSGDDYATSIQQTPDGGYIFGGNSSSNDGDVSGNQGDYDYWVVKLNATGDIQWQKSFGGSNFDQLTVIRQTLDGGYLAAGESFSDDGDVIGNHGNNDYWVIKLDESGNIEWQKTLGGSYPDGAYDMQLTADGGYILAGNSWSNDGDVSGNHGYGDFWIVKLTGSVGLNETINKTIFSVYPNPATDLITIKDVSPKTELIITNTYGEIVFKTVAKNNELTIDVSELPAGMYFINGQKFIKK
ncbi:MAG: T9SS type A sorting domain-containing protein [Bacteroidales bacterium]|nr:T9SS type A sorting domain-containing protein [Bacteroidales bacterium]MDD3700150.1 T9SS type A sorting domain-containing protein [Bacteroidales bacterium]MDY0369026.1 T9SS type A sorting domain-containing protein [Bacteroidales bacterium]